MGLDPGGRTGLAYEVFWARSSHLLLTFIDCRFDVGAPLGRRKRNWLQRGLTEATAALEALHVPLGCARFFAATAWPGTETLGGSATLLVRVALADLPNAPLAALEATLGGDVLGQWIEPALLASTGVHLFFITHEGYGGAYGTDEDLDRLGGKGPHTLSGDNPMPLRIAPLCWPP